MDSRVPRTKRAQQNSWRQWKAEEAQEHLAAWRASGLPLGTFARQRGLSAERLRWWKKRQGDWSEEKPPSDRSALVPVVVTPAAAAPEERGSRAAVVVRVPGGAVVEVVEPEEVRAEWLAAVVGQLSRCAG